MNTTKVDTAVRLFSEGSSCAQAILSVFAPQVGVKSGLGNKLGSGLGAGAGRKQYLCGAVNAGAIILSLQYGSEDPVDAAPKERSYEAVRDFLTVMEAEFGSCDCREILGVSIETPEERREAQRQGFFDTVCRNCVEKVAEYLVRELDTSV